MASWELLGFGSTGWGALLIAAALMTLAFTATALAIGAVLGAIVAAAKLSG
ncbi:ABC transporter permease, partial [Rhizobium ruizarguesonis]